MLSHTPGPWHNYGPIIHKSGQHIAHVVCDDRNADGDRGSDEQRANAKLIKEAPRLLDELKRLRDQCTLLMNERDLCWNDLNLSYDVDSAIEDAESHVAMLTTESA